MISTVMVSMMTIIKLNIACGVLLIIMITTLSFNIMMVVMMNVMGILMTDITLIITSSNPNTT